MQLIIRDGNLIVWPSGGGIGWNPCAYTYTVDGEQFERLLGRRRRGAPPKLSAETLKNEVERRRREGLRIGQNYLAQHFQVHRKTIGRLLKK